jgi:Predicted acyltransferases
MVQNASGDYIPAIDGLRALAVSMVILYHMDAFPLLRGGFTGVDVFFVISGYVISRSLASAPELKLPRYILEFYRRRLVRIVPALLAMLLVTTLAAVLFIPASWLSRAMDDSALAAFFGCANLLIARDEGGYFSPKAELNPFLHTWSLGVEEQFYLLFPLVCFFLPREGRAQGRSAGSAAASALAELGLAALAISSLLFSMIESSRKAANAYYLLPSRFWELATGALLFLAHGRGALLPRRAIDSDIFVGAGLGLIGAGALLADQGAFPFPWALPPVLGAALAISGTIGQGTANASFRRLLCSPALAYVGRLSYSLYLWHWPVSALSRWTLGFESAGSKALYLASTLILSAASHHLIENPIRRSPSIKRLASWKVAVGALAMLAATSLSAWRLWASRSELSLSVTKDSFVWQSGNYEADGPAEPITDDPLIRGRRLFAVGDSHAAAYRTMLNIIAKELGVEVHEYEEGDCAVPDLLRPMDQKAKVHYETALKDIKTRARPGDVVFLPALRMPTFADQFEPIDVGQVARAYLGEKAVADRERALEEAKTIVAAFAATGAYVVMEAPLPVLLAPPYRCSDWFNRMNPVGANGLAVSRAFLEEMRKPVMRSISALRGGDKSLYVWDPFPILCKDETFSAYDHRGEPLFWDGDHLSGNGNRVLAPSFESFLVALWTGKAEGLGRGEAQILSVR